VNGFFLADDDIGLCDLINKTFENINKTGVKAVSIKCNNEKSIFRSVFNGVVLVPVVVCGEQSTGKMSIRYGF
jgi:hypothetical protein